MSGASSAISLLRQAFEQSLAARFPAFAFRLPGGHTFYWGACAVDRLVTLGADRLPDEGEGFLFAPFDREALPTLFFPVRPAPVEELAPATLKALVTPVAEAEEAMPLADTDYPSYERQAQTLVEAMARGELRKAVLSRTVTLPRPAVSDVELFVRLAARYPSAFVSWVHLPGGSRWIGATPETLLDYDGRELSTMALAGTRRAGSPGEWGQKEQDEQQIVADSIVASLAGCGLAPVVGSRFTRQAAQVEHLCTPVSVEGHLDREQLTRVLSALHPTPAVGGYPKEAAKEWIDRVEAHRRRYYGGFLGPIEGEGVRLFVNLRCMEMNKRHVRLYVGGGLTAQSLPASEWSETEAKAQTLLSVLNG